MMRQLNLSNFKCLRVKQRCVRVLFLLLYSRGREGRTGVGKVVFSSPPCKWGAESKHFLEKASNITGF